MAANDRNTATVVLEGLSYVKVDVNSYAFFVRQVAQQEAQRAQFVVEKAVQERQQKVVQAEGEAIAAKLVRKPFNNLHTVNLEYEARFFCS